MNLEQVKQTLNRLFERHRIVFWYDTNQDLRGEFESLDLPGVTKLELQNKQYQIKYRILREEPKQKFLLYHQGPQPEDSDNWLLDVQLANTTFSADKVSMFVAELGLRPEFIPLVQEHAEFCNVKPRREALKALLNKEDNHNAIRTKMLAVCVGKKTEPRLDHILEELLSELAQDRDEKISLIQDCHLDEFLYQRMERHFGYTSGMPGMRDFVITLFRSCYALSLEEDAELTQEALVFLKRWKDSLSHKPTFEILSEEYAKDPALKRDLQERDFQTLIEIDYFKLVDQKILADLIQHVLERTISVGECARIIWNRRTTHWFGEYSDIYEAVNYASKFIAELDLADLTMQSLNDGIEKYQNTWYLLDQFYRKFIYHVRACKQNTLLKGLIEQIENLYANNFLLALNDNWQKIIDQTVAWEAPSVIRQDGFFDNWVQEYIKHNNKVAVIISDALRFEIGQDIATQIEQENRYSATLEPMLSMLPSYTQLGMASLLPHEQAKIMENGLVEVDGQKTSGKENRSKILSKAIDTGGTAIRSEDFLSLNKEQLSDLFREHNVVYIYHNQIDAAGDALKTEERVFDASQDAVNEILAIMKKYYGLSYTYALITADHGFLYQHRPIDESVYAAVDITGDQIYLRNRRFVVGKSLDENPSAKKFSAQELGLAGEYEISIPKSINRLRLKGSGSRYVHGGTSLQEVVLPVITVHKKRTSDLGSVDVDVITSSTSIITTGQLSVAFYQTEPVSAKLQARTLRVGIYSKDKELISNPEELNFDFTSDNPREREVKLRFVLSRKADDVNNQTVYLLLEEIVPGTAQTREYKSFTYQLRRSFTSDFDL